MPEAASFASSSSSVSFSPSLSADLTPASEPDPPPPKPRRNTTRRYDPLKRRTPQDWLRAFRRLHRVSPAVIVAAKRVAWDYPAIAHALEPIAARYVDLRRLPCRRWVGLVLLAVGYPEWQVARSLRTYGGDKDSARRLEVNAIEHDLRSRVGAAFTDENEEDRRCGRSSLPEIRLKF